MSNVIDKRVVEMQFNNADFEKNTKQTMSTLDKLKAKLKLKGSADSMKDLGEQARIVDERTSSLCKSTQKVSVTMKALDIVKYELLEKIINRIIDSTEKLVKNLTIDQVSAGWEKYAEKTEAVQTIMAATKEEFSDTAEQMSYVNDELERLNWFTDETSYNFVDMVSNIGKFTSNNIDLETSVTAMEGIANWAAISGANASEASRAMYNLSQAISTGSVKLIDWKSIENANMATAEFKQNAIETAESYGTLIKVGDDLWETLEGNTVSVSNFNNALSDAWFTSDVLLSTLSKYGSFTNELNDTVQSLGVSTNDVLDEMDYFRENSQFSEEFLAEIGETFELNASQMEELEERFASLTSDQNALGESSFRAAQEAKTFAEALGSVKDAASTTWMNIFEMIFGDYLEAKTLWTQLANDMYDIFVEPLNAEKELIQEWAEGGGQTSLINGLMNLMENLKTILSEVNSAFRYLFPKITSDRLIELSKKFEAFTEKIKLTDEKLQKFRKTIKYTLATIRLLINLIKLPFVVAFRAIKVAIEECDISLFSFSDVIETVYNILVNWIEKNEGLTKTLEYLAYGIYVVIKSIKLIASTALTLVSVVLSQIPAMLSKMATKISSIWDTITTGFAAFFGVISDYFKDFDFSLTGFVQAFRDGIVSMWQATSDQLGGITTLVQSWWEKLKKVLSNINLGSLIAIAFGGSALKVLPSVMRMFSKITAPAVAFASLMNSISYAIKKSVRDINAKAVMHYAAAITMLSAAFVALSYMNVSNFWQALGAIAAMSAIIAGLAVAVNEFSTVGDRFTSGFKTAAVLSSLAIGMILVVSSVAVLARIINNNGSDKLWMALGVLTIIITELAAVAIVISKFAPKITIGVAFFIAFGIGLNSIINVMDKIKDKSISEMYLALKKLVPVMLLFTTIGAAMSFISSSGGLKILAALAVILLITNRIKNLSDYDFQRIITGMENLKALFWKFVPVLAAARLAGKNAAKVGAMMIGLSVAMLAMSGVVSILGSLNTDKLKHGLVAVSVIMAMFALLTASTGLAKYAKEARGTILAMTIAMVMLTTCTGIMALIPADKLLPAAGAISVLTFSFAALVAASKNAKKAWFAVLQMTVCVGALTLLMSLLTQQPWQQTIAAGAAMSALILSLSAAMRVATKADKITWNAVLALGAMIVALGTVGLVLTWTEKLTGRDLDVAIETAASLSLLLLAMSSAMWIISKGGKMSVAQWGESLGSLVVMSAIVAILGQVLTVLTKKFPTSKGSLARLVTLVGSLSILINAIASACLILSLGKGMNAKALGAAAIMGAIVLALGTVFISMLNLVPHGDDDLLYLIVMAGSLSLLINAIASACLILSFSKAINNTTVGIAATMGAVVAVLSIAIATACLIGKENLNNALKICLGLSALINAIAAACLIVSFSAPTAFNKQTLLTVGVMGAIVSAVAVAIGAACAIGKDHLDNALSIVLGLSAFVVALAAAVVILSVVKAFPFVAALEGLAFFAITIAAIGAILYLLGSLNEYLKEEGVNLEYLMDQGLPLLEKCGEAIGSVLSGVISPIFDGVTNWEARLAALELTIQGITELSGIIQEFVDANTTDAFSDSAEALKNFVIGFNSISTEEKTIEKRVDNFKMIAECLRDNAASISSFMNTVGITRASAFHDYADGIALLVSSVSDSKLKTSTIEKFKDFIETLVEDDFAGLLTSVSTAAEGIDLSAMDNAKTAFEYLTDMAEYFTQTTKIVYGSVLGIVGAGRSTSSGVAVTALSEFMQSLTGDSSTGKMSFMQILRNLTIQARAIKTGDLNSLEIAEKAFTYLTDMAREVPTDLSLSGGYGVTDLGDFIRTIITQQLPQNIKLFAQESKDITLFDVYHAKSIFLELCSMGEALKDAGMGVFNTAGVQTFISTGIPGMATAISTYYETVKDADLDVIAESIDLINQLMWLAIGIGQKDFTAFNEIMTTDANGSNQLIESFKNLGAINDIVSAMAKSIKDTGTDEFSSAGSYLDLQLALGINDGKETPIANATQMAEDCLTGIKNVLGDAYSAGFNYAHGFSQGITAKLSSVTAAGAKVPMALGNGMVQGVQSDGYTQLAQAGINGAVDKVVKATDDCGVMAEEAGSKFTEAIGDGAANSSENVTDGIVDGAETGATEATGLLKENGLIYNAIAGICKTFGWDFQTTWSTVISWATKNGLASGFSDGWASFKAALAESNLGTILGQSITNFIGEDGKLDLEAAKEAAIDLIDDDIFGTLTDSITEGLEGLTDTATETGGAGGSDAVESIFDTIKAKYEDELQKLEDEIEINNLELDIWKLLNPNATDSQIDAKEIETNLANYYNYLQEYTDKAEIYQKVLEAAGDETERTAEEAQDVRDAYIDMLNAQKTVLEQGSTVQDAWKEDWEYQEESMKTYEELMKEHEEEIQASIDSGEHDYEYWRDYYAEQADWDIELWRKMMHAGGENASVDSILSYYTKDMEVLEQEGSDTAENTGESIGTALGDGITTATIKSTSLTSIGKVLEASTYVTDDLKTKWKESGTTLANEFLNGLSEGFQSMVDKTTELVEKLTEAIDLAAKLKEDGITPITVSGMSTGTIKTASVTADLAGSVSQTASNAQAAQTVTYTFNQTNNSPKAISAADSYRNGKTLIAVMKNSTGK